MKLVRCNCGKVIKQIKSKRSIKVVIDAGCDYFRKYVRKPATQKEKE